MDIKDVNNGLLNLLQANRLNAQNNAANIGGGFGDLLAGLENNQSAAADAKDGFRDAKETASADFSKPRPADKPEVRDDKKTDKGASEPVRKDNARPAEDKAGSKEGGSPDKSADKSQKADSSVAESKNVSADKKAGNESSEVASGKNDSDAGVETIPAEEVVEDIAAAGSSEGDSLENYKISLEDLALLGTVVVVNPLTGEMSQVTGAELAAKLAAAGVEAVAAVPQENGLLQVVPMADDVADAGAFQDVLNKMQPVEPSKIEMVLPAAEKASSDTADAPEVAVAKNADILEEQAAKLGDVIGSERKVKVEVNVKAEKIADVVDGGLVKNVKLADDVVAAIVEGDGNANPLTENKTSILQPATLQTQSNQTAQAKDMALTMAAGAANTTAAAAVADDAAVAAAPSEAASVTLAGVGTTGSEVLANAKPAAANDSSSSFRDVYKGMGKEVVDQIKVNITKSAVKGVDKIEIQLKPEDLGQIEVKMQIGKDGKLQAHIISSRPEIAEILQKEMANLQKAFNEAGFQTDEGSLSFSFREDGQAGQNQEKNNLRNFIGDVLEQETVMDAASGDLFAGTAWDGKNGLNIRV